MDTMAAGTRPRKGPSLEKLRADWHWQLLADHKHLNPSAVYVAIAISLHMNRDQGGWAFPGLPASDRL